MTEKNTLPDVEARKREIHTVTVVRTIPAVY